MDASEENRLRGMFSRKKSKSRESWKFETTKDFIAWWNGQLNDQRGQCAYCETKLSTIQELIKAGKIGTRSTRGNGIRGASFELERRNPFGDYSPDNCALVCLYCNNDKSNVYDDPVTYKKFFGEARRRHFEWLPGALSKDAPP